MKADIMLVFFIMIQGPLVHEEFIPKQYMKFDEVNDAYKYYCDYAKMPGFDVRKGRKSPQVQWFFCNKEGDSVLIVQINKRRMVL
jgi:hypothetical protein